MKCLNDLSLGDKCIVEQINNLGNINNRFRDIGLIEKTLVECVSISPMGDPKAYLIRSAVFAIRNDDAKNIIVSEWKR